jgi:hypothetical protein
VKGVRDKYGVRRCGLEVGIVNCTDIDVNVPVSLSECSYLQKKQGQLPKIDSNHPPFGPDRRGQLQSKVARPGTQIDNDASWPHIKGLDDVCRALPSVALGFHGRQPLKCPKPLKSDSGDADYEKERQKNQEGAKSSENAFEDGHGVVFRLDHNALGAVFDRARAQV